ncbi:amino acid transporter [Trifolium pratense]|uniref:Amino acid transporter n=1 Tax=Trifolium pratense TaxID=57577 RepID=A0A2K3LMG2_TRIPR|nr:amino acid transporter [Trifolium pratense]
MTIGNLAPKTEKKKSSRKSKNKAIVSENTPLLPKSQAHESDSGFDDFNGASFSGAVFNLATTIIGAGIMALPATLKQLGLIPGLAAILIMAFLTEKSIELLIRFTRAGKSVSYAGLMGDSFGTNETEQEMQEEYHVVVTCCTN